MQKQQHIIYSIKFQFMNSIFCQFASTSTPFRHTPEHVTFPRYRPCCGNTLCYIMTKPTHQSLIAFKQLVRFMGLLLRFIIPPFCNCQCMAAPTSNKSSTPTTFIGILRRWDVYRYFCSMPCCHLSPVSQTPMVPSSKLTST